MPKMHDMSVRQLVVLTGLSDYYLWQVRKGEKRLHARVLGADSVSLERRTSVSRESSRTPPMIPDRMLSRPFRSVGFPPERMLTLLPVGRWKGRMPRKLVRTLLRHPE